MCSAVQDIRKSFASLRVEKKLRHREIAHFLEITEAELIDAHVGISKLDVIKSSPQMARAVRLKKPWVEWMPMIQKLGDVMSLTKNSSAVHEVMGSYKNAYSENGVHKIVFEHLQLKLKYQFWEFAYLFEESKSNAVQRSIQFFDESGQAIYKIFLLPDSHHWYFDEIAKRYGDVQQSPGIFIHEKGDEDSLCQSSQLTRLDELKGLTEDSAKHIDIEAMRFILSSATHLNLPLMIVVSNQAIQQTYQGPIHEMVEIRSWVHLINQEFNLHLDLRNTPHIWLVHNPHQENMKSTIELLNEEGCSVVMISHAEHAELEHVKSWQNLIKRFQIEEVCLLNSLV